MIVHFILMGCMDVIVRPMVSRMLMAVHMLVPIMGMFVRMLMFMFMDMGVSVFMHVSLIPVPVFMGVHVCVLMRVEVLVFVCSFHS